MNRIRRLASKPASLLARKLAGRSARYGSNVLVLSIATLGIVILLNVLAARYYKRFDVTQARLHTLSPQSIQVLNELDGEIEVIGFYPNGQDQEAFERWLDEYQAHTDTIRYRAVDPIRQPGEADRLGWDAYGAGWLVQRGDRSHQVYIPDEQDITSALLRVSREGPKVIYFLSGHNERSPSDYGGTGYGDVATLLEANNYQVLPLNLVVDEAVPSDAAAVVIAGPQTPLLQEETQRLKDYLLGGGKALLLIDPGLVSIPDVNDLLEPWQVRFDGRPIVDMWQSLSDDPLTPVIDRFEFHQITKDLSNLLIALPLATPIELAPETQMLPTHLVLATTSEGSWAETDPDLAQAQYDEVVDLPGPLIVVATVESAPSAGSTRLALIGDSDLARNDVLQQIPNGQYLVLNAINWLAEEESLIAIGPKTRVPQTIRLSRVQEGAVCLGTLFLIPAAIAAAGIVVWARRRQG
jgi:ABC-type uncharacterized transport system involved in gliding motility auxiliary subunit